MLRNALCSVGLFLCSFSFSAIVETSFFREIYQHIDKETLIVLDIDDTLLIPKQMLGSDEWFCHRIKLYQSQGLDKAQALETALAEWEGIRHVSQMQLVEPLTHLIIEDLQKQGYPIIGLTTQGLGLATRTYLQLKENEIDLTKTAPFKKDCFFQLQEHGILFRHGILFTSGQSKAECFERLCAHLNVHPQKIIFVNDKQTHLADLEAYATAKEIPFIGLRYGYSDFRKKAFNAKIADYQFSHSSFSRILSDEEALKELSIK